MNIGSQSPRVLLMLLLGYQRFGSAKNNNSSILSLSPLYKFQASSYLSSTSDIKLQIACHNPTNPFFFIANRYV
jgi:hypothetical protein